VRPRRGGAPDFGWGLASGLIGAYLACIGVSQTHKLSEATRERLEAVMRVSDGMSALVLVIGPGHTLRQAARLMAARGCGSAVVLDADGAGYGILTERDVLLALAAGKDPDVEIAADHLTRDLVFADPEWPLDVAADAMLRGGFRHLVVTDGGTVAGILSMRDVVRCWNRQRVSA